MGEVRRRLGSDATAASPNNLGKFDKGIARRLLSLDGTDGLYSI